MTVERFALVVGVGNHFRCDDGFGLAVIEALEGRLPEGVDSMVHDGEPLGLLEQCRDYDVVVIVDVSRSGAEPGTVRTFDGLDGAVPVPTSTHGGGPATAVALSGVLERMPSRLVFVTAEAASTDHGTELSDPVREAVSEAVDTITAMLRALGAG